MSMRDLRTLRVAFRALSTSAMNSFTVSDCRAITTRLDKFVSASFSNLSCLKSNRTGTLSKCSLTDALSIVVLKFETAPARLTLYYCVAKLALVGLCFVGGIFAGLRNSSWANYGAIFLLLLVTTSDWTLMICVSSAICPNGENPSEVASSP